MILGIRRPPPQNLTEWLESATWELVPSARARIAEEIEAHYVESVSSQLARGRAESEARAMALADLGDVNAAAVRFRHEYLTNGEFGQPNRVFRTNPARGSLLNLYLLLPINADFLRPGVREGVALPDWRFFITSSFALGLSLVVIALNFRIYTLSRRKNSLTTLRRMALLSAISWLILGLISLISMGAGLSAVLPLLPQLVIGLPASACLVFLAIGMGHECLRVRRKLATATPEDISSQPPAAA